MIIPEPSPTSELLEDEAENNDCDWPKSLMPTLNFSAFAATSSLVGMLEVFFAVGVSESVS